MPRAEIKYSFIVTFFSVSEELESEDVEHRLEVCAVDPDEAHRVALMVHRSKNLRDSCRVWCVSVQPKYWKASYPWKGKRLVFGRH
jgi:hypothetical protein